MYVDWCSPSSIVEATYDFILLLVLLWAFMYGPCDCFSHHRRAFSQSSGVRQVAQFETLNEETILARFASSECYSSIVIDLLQIHKSVFQGERIFFNTVV